MPRLVQRVSTRVDALRRRHAVVDHAVRTVVHYSDRNGNGQAGAVTFFAFLSFFPILALAFWAVGHVSELYPDLRAEVVETVEQVLPGLVGDREGQISLWQIEQYAATAGWFGLLGVLYTGLNWVSAMRRALGAMFQLPDTERPNFFLGKLRDLGVLVTLGAILLVSISMTGGISWFSGLLLGALGLDGSWLATGLLAAVGYALAVLATTLLLVAMFRLLARPHVARRALWQGAFAGAVGFELLKSVAGALFAITRESPSFQAFGITLILLVWINYFSRLVMLSAAWAYTAPVAERLRSLESEPLLTPEEAEDFAPAPAAVVAEDGADSPLPGERRRRRRRERIGGSALAAVAVAGLTWLGRRRHG